MPSVGAPERIKATLDHFKAVHLPKFDWTAEFATAKWIRPWPQNLAGQVTAGDLAGPVGVRSAVAGGLPPVLASVYDDSALAKPYPFHALLKAQLQTYGIRPKTPAYSDVTLAIQKTLSPTSNISPSSAVGTLRDQIGKALTSSALL